MIRRTIAAALLTGLAAPILAGQFAGPAYDQAAGMAAGRSAGEAYDGNTTRPAVQIPPARIPATDSLAVETAPAAALPAIARPGLATIAVPEPTREARTDEFPAEREDGGSRRVPPLGGCIGAAVGALSGCGIGFLLSKLLR